MGVSTDTPPTGGTTDDGPTGLTLGLDQVTKVFGGHVAVDDVSFQMAPGQVTALLGENGAGKSTCVKLLSGVHQPDHGSVIIDGDPVVVRSPLDARRRGIAMVNQHPELFDDLSIAENLFVGALPTRSGGRVDHAAMREATRRALDELGLARSPSDRVGDLSASEQQLVEIARALVADAPALILDEPTASLSRREVDRLFGVVDRLRRRGVAVLFVGHRLDEIFRIADSAVVLRDGRFVAHEPIAALSPDRVVSLMVGRQIDLTAARTPAPTGDTVLAVRGLGRDGEFADIDLEVRAGEVVGLGGLVGSGRTELARCVFGINRPDTGTIELDGIPRRWRSAGQAIDAGVAYLSEDRRGQSLILDTGILANATLAALDQTATAGLVSRSRAIALVDPPLRRLELSFRGYDEPVGELSGGNQQKVALAKWMATHPRLIILDEPTQGIDVATKAEVHRVIDEFATAGLAVIVISSDLPELIAVSDRVVVMREGRAVAEIGREELDEHSVIAAATGLAAIADAPIADPVAGTGVADEVAGTDVEGEVVDTAASDGRTRWRAVLARRELGLVAAIVAFTIVVTIINDRFLSSAIQRNLARDVAILAIIALGEMLVMLTRNIDLSVSSIVGLSAYLTADFVRDHHGAPVLLALGVGLAVGALCGLINGLIVAAGQVPSIVATLGTMAIFRGAVAFIAGTSQVSADQVTSAWRSLSSNRILGIPVFTLLALGILIVAAALLRSRRLGRELFAVGSNPAGARLAGIPARRRVVQSFVFSGLLAGLAGSLTASRYATVDARVAVGLELTVVASVVVGGVALRGGSGTVLGVALGALLLLVIQVGLPLAHVDSLWLDGVYGLVILVAVTVDVVVGRATGRRHRPADRLATAGSRP